MLILCECDYMSLISVLEIGHPFEGLNNQYEAVIMCELACQTDAKRRKATGDVHEQSVWHATLYVWLKKDI